ncbi:MAG: histidine kinase N-terminal 7TM domain-containing protein [Haloarculaceae archaeon]
METNALWFGGYLGAAVAMAVAAFVFWTHRTVRGAQYLLVGAVVGSVAALCYAMAMLAPAAAASAILWQLVVALGGALALLWTLFVLRWTGREQLAGLPAIGLAAVPVAVSVGLLATNISPAVDGYHDLFFAASPGVGSGPFTPPAITLGPLGRAFEVYLAALVAVDVALLARFGLRPAQRLFRWRNVMLVLAGVAALLFGIGFQFLDVPYVPGPFVAALASGFVAVAIARFGVYDVVSLPERSLVEAIEGGVLVYNTDGTVVAVDREAGRLLGVGDEAVGSGIVALMESVEVLPGVRGDGTAADGGATRAGSGTASDGQTDGGAASAATAPASNGPPASGSVADDPGAIAELLDDHEFTTAVGGATRSVHVRVSDLPDDDGERLGWTVLFYDVTDLRQKQHELDLLKQVLSRVLRHNVRNDLSVVKANAQMLADEAEGLEAERLRTIVEKSQDLLDASEKARTVERLLGGERTRSEFDLAEIVPEAVAAVEREFPAVEIETDLPAACPVRAHWALSTAVENVVENAAMHNDADEPRVAVRVAADGDRATLTVADNGPGIPQGELAVLDRREETPLEHGSSVGLWLVDWVVDLSRGELAFENDDRGCTVTVTLERAD